MLHDLHGLVEILVLVVLTELGSDTFILIVLLTRKHGKIIAVVLVSMITALLLLLFTRIGSRVLPKYVSGTKL